MSNVKGIDIKQLLKRFGKSKSGRESSLSVNSLSQISDRLIHISRGQNISRVSMLVCIILCAFFISDLFALLFEKYIPTPPISMLANRTSQNNNAPRLMNYEIISERNLFSSKAPTKTGNEIDLNADPVPTTLPFQLIGTVIFKNPTRSLGAVQDKTDSKVFPVRMGDDIDERAQILSVEPRRVVFINNQSRRKEFVEIPEDPSVKITAAPRKVATGGIDKVDDNKYVVKRAEIDAQMANFNNLLTQARAVPEMCGGQMVGFKLMQIQPNSFYQKIGLKENCTIRSVNGEKMTDAAKALSLLQDLKHMNSLDLGVVCGGCDGKESDINYDIQ